MELQKWAQGNPGAFVCLMGLLKYEDLVAQVVIILKIKKLEIFGTDLYVLWSDISNKDYALMAYLCENVPENVLKDASSRQDYSGIELCKPYILQFYTDKTVEKF